MVLIAKLSREDRAAMEHEREEMYAARAEQTKRESFEQAALRVENGEPNAMNPGALRNAAQTADVEIDEEPKPTRSRAAAKSGEAPKRQRRQAGQAIGQETPAANERGSADGGEADDEEDGEDGQTPESEAAGLGA